MGQKCTLVVVVVLGLVSLGLTLTALMTQNWYKASAGHNVEPAVRQFYSFHFGLWKLCYDEGGIPTDIAQDDRYESDGDCVYLYNELIQRDEEDLDSDTRLRLHLSRTVLGCNIAGAAFCLAGLLTLLCGLCRARNPSRSVRGPCVYLTASVLLLLATMCGIASGIAFIALRDIDNTESRPPYSSSSSSSSSSVMPLPPALPEYVDQEYSWSFMVHWIGTGLALVGSFLLLCLLHNSYEFVGEDPSKKSRYYSRV